MYGMHVYIHACVLRIYAYIDTEKYSISISAIYVHTILSVFVYSYIFIQQQRIDIENDCLIINRCCHQVFRSRGVSTLSALRRNSDRFVEAAFPPAAAT